jgi:predicted nucleotidyltransferase
MIFNNNFSDFINLLEEHKVRYVLVGGLAVVMNGHFRTTKDMDIFYEGKKENCIRLLKAIQEFGFGYLRLTIDDLMDGAGFIKLGREPERIDLFCELPGVEFEEVHKHAFDYKEERDPFVVKVIHINHLIQNKKAVGRHQDLDDVKKLEKILKRKNK